MHIFLPSSDELSDDFRTSFTFDDESEQNSFMTWLGYMDIEYVKAKIPCIVDGKLTQQTCVVINSTQTKDNSESVQESTKNDKTTETLTETVNEVEAEQDHEEPVVEVKKKKKKSKHTELDE